jgi:hypothetical protein
VYLNLVSILRGLISARGCQPQEFALLGEGRKPGYFGTVTMKLD